MTNIVLLSSILLTNITTAFIGKTNNAAILTHLETISRRDIEGLKQRFHKTVPFRTNVVIINQRQWQEAVRDLEPAASALKQNPAPAPAVSKPINTNSPAFLRRQQMLNKQAK